VAYLKKVDVALVIGLIAFVPAWGWCGQAFGENAWPHQGSSD